jgi:hypothetical protein
VPACASDKVQFQGTALTLQSSFQGIGQHYSMPLFRQARSARQNRRFAGGNYWLNARKYAVYMMSLRVFRKQSADTGGHDD